MTLLINLAIHTCLHVLAYMSLLNMGRVACCGFTCQPKPGHSYK